MAVALAPAGAERQLGLCTLWIALVLGAVLAGYAIAAGLTYLGGLAGVLLGVLVLLIAAIRPHLSLCLTALAIGCSPTFFFPFPQATVLTVARLAVMVALVGWAARALIARELRCPPLATGLAVSAWLLAAVLSMLAAANLDASLKGLGAFAIAVAILLLAVDQLRKEEHLRSLAYALSAVLAINCAVTIFSGGYSVHTEEGLLRYGGLRDVNSTGYLVSMLAPMAFFLLWDRATRWPAKVFLFGLLPAFVVTLLLTVSRGAFLAALAMGMVALWRWPGRGRGLLLAGAGIALAVTLVNLSGTSYLRRMNSLVIASDRDENIINRRVAWVAALDMARTHPLTGVGVGSFRYELAEYTQRLGYTLDLMVAHEGYLEAAAETGVLGLCAFLGMWIASAVAIARARRGLRKADQERSFTALFISAVECGLVVAAVQNLFMSAHTRELLWLYFGLAAVCLRLSTSELVIPPAQTHAGAART